MPGPLYQPSQLLVQLSVGPVICRPSYLSAQWTLTLSHAPTTSLVCHPRVEDAVSYSVVALDRAGLKTSLAQA
jgi:hypothetical protein